MCFVLQRGKSSFIDMGLLWMPRQWGRDIDASPELMLRTGSTVAPNALITKICVAVSLNEANVCAYECAGGHDIKGPPKSRKLDNTQFNFMIHNSISKKVLRQSHLAGRTSMTPQSP